jgi:hypothetical protein
MKKMVLVIALAAFAAPALDAAFGTAWAMGGGRNKGDAQQNDANKEAAAKKAKETDRAYKEALKKIPDGKASNDPWSKVR